MNDSYGTLIYMLFKSPQSLDLQSTRKAVSCIMLLTMLEVLPFCRQKW